MSLSESTTGNLLTLSRVGWIWIVASLIRDFIPVVEELYKEIARRMLTKQEERDMEAVLVLLFPSPRFHAQRWLRSETAFQPGRSLGMDLVVGVVVVA